jgi:hypothetical protein
VKAIDVVCAACGAGVGCDCDASTVTIKTSWSGRFHPERVRLAQDTERAINRKLREQK